MSADSSSITSSGSEDGNEPEYTLDQPDVVTKYKTAGGIANVVLAHVVPLVVADARIVDICLAGDQKISEEVAKVYNNKKGIEKGIAFPTCVSVNNCLGHYSPLASEGGATLKAGDLVKIDLGVHIDGCPAVVAHSLVVGAPAATERAADVITAAATAVQAAIRSLRPGVKNSDITTLIAKIAGAYGVQPMEGVLSHEMKRWVVDGPRVIANRASIDHKVDEWVVEAGMVIAIDVLMSTGEGNSREQDARTTVFKRAVEEKYKLKMAASRATFSEINTKFPALPFTLRALEDERRGRLGIVEMLKHDLVHPYPVLYEAPGVLVAQCKATAVILPSGTVSVIASHDPCPAESAHSITDPDIIALLARAVPAAKKKRNKKKGKKAAKDGDDGADDGGDDGEDEEAAAPAPAPAPAAKGKKAPAAATPAAAAPAAAKAAAAPAPSPKAAAAPAPSPKAAAAKGAEAPATSPKAAPKKPEAKKTGKK